MTPTEWRQQWLMDAWPVREHNPENPVLRSLLERHVWHCRIGKVKKHVRRITVRCSCGGSVFAAPSRIRSLVAQVRATCGRDSCRLPSD